MSTAEESKDPKGESAPTTIHQPSPEAQEAQEAQESESASPPFQTVKFTIATLVIGISVLFLFVSSLSYLFGSQYQSASKSHNFKILLVDYDNGGVVSQSLFAAYNQLKGPTFPTLVTANVSQYPTTQTLIDAVHQQRYWGAVFVKAGASGRLEAAMSPHPATPYNASDAVGYVWNEIRYPTISGSIVRPNIITLGLIAQALWQQESSAVGSLLSAVAKNSTQTALKTYLNPISPAEISPWPAAQMAKVFYNTVAMAMPIVQQNMFLITFNAFASSLGVFSKFSLPITGLLLFGISLVFTFLGALTTTSYIWAFKESWNVGGRQFAETWMALWLVMHIYYMLIDAFLSLWHMAFYPFIIVTFIFLNIASTCFPLEFSPGFYRWGQALPAYATLQVLIDIWSSSTAKLYQSFPVLFAWWVVALGMAGLGVLKRWRAAHPATSLPA